MTSDDHARATTDLRDIPEADLDQALDLVHLAFHLKPADKTRAYHRRTLRACTRIGAYGDGRLSGVAGAHRVTLSVPGGQLPCAALDFVSVAPTHRRRGILTAMLDELWRRCAAEQRPVSCLWASESAIYGRFGYGAATESYRIEIDSSRPLALRIAPDSRPLRLIDPADAPTVLAPRYDATLPQRAGRFLRDAAWWREHVLDLDGSRGGDDRDGFGAARVVALGDPGGIPAGYAVYRTRGPGENRPGAVLVDELEAESAPVAAALWSYLASIDLTSTVRIEARPADDPLLHLVADRDQVRVTGQEPSLWLRLVDVRAALTARSWAAPVDLVLDLRDPALPANAGRFRLTAGPDGATWHPTTETPDLALDVRELASCYLGGTPLRHFVHAGLVTEHTPGAAHHLDAALATEWLPFTGENY
ncbi:GNAT family N-acetyltransferase [Streptomyces lydicamycinicus]|uniref:GNAT family N-acetyltransferase n=1 Tax=Streptomyces lydicamycinicus TaxID=1546107 RepID=UPI0020355CB8|nr:GNAT family N-acetyltransferase [Streptomyces lydicamycinicus]USA00672.1 GNAT family N-acetyltransferase [Streptomyces lydicamycinicus]